MAEAIEAAVVEAVTTAATEAAMVAAETMTAAKVVDVLKAMTAVTKWRWKRCWW